jgi:hypothetical protein
MRWLPRWPSHTATPVLADEMYAIAVLRMPWGNRGSGTTRSPAGAVATSPAGASRCEATLAARRRYIRTSRKS